MQLNQLVELGEATLRGNLNLLVIGILLLAFAFFFLRVIKNLVANAILGLLALFALKFILGIAIPINIATLLVSAIFGLAGVGSLALLYFFGVIG